MHVHNETKRTPTAVSEPCAGAAAFLVLTPSGVLRGRADAGAERAWPVPAHHRAVGAAPDLLNLKRECFSGDDVMALRRGGAVPERHTPRVLDLLRDAHVPDTG
jgi:hypothetical protein